ncbi:YcbK family protein [Niveispirillum fermenti]|uniref:YcbK family protein n=1 Tax=Niveispirillum fermenti TaxID=1233113 RepID=UPI003A886B8D
MVARPLKTDRPIGDRPTGDLTIESGADLSSAAGTAPSHSDPLALNEMSGRRGFLRGLGGLFLGAGAAIAAPTILTSPADAASVNAARRSLSFMSLHTKEKLRVTYYANGTYDKGALSDINQMLRDWRTGEVGTMDPKLMDLLFQLRQRLRSDDPFHVISGYRCPKTNAMLASKSDGVATKSLHMVGKAIDITMPGRQLARIRQEAAGLRLGGVGIYSKSGFVHVDTGKVRYWGA